ncbi:hypothetical protein KVG96_23530 [Pseudomonas sp. COR58]|uniref:Uncharacterized protein n=1 Tax=Pseudomonas ekonensis TaxID=2842353 RepID=A0ABS6PKD5_9PSED|nr:hypothetical protein [Pseudomonas ekonensis]MBV4460936.1 hypothetical protein [Pseudomonas ekonensis]
MSEMTGHCRSHPAFAETGAAMVDQRRAGMALSLIKADRSVARQRN